MISVKELFRRSKEAELAQKNEAKSAGKKAGEKKEGREKRCSFLVEEIFESARIQGVMVIGNLHGRVREEDTLYLYQPDKPVKQVQVIGIELGPREVVERIARLVWDWISRISMRYPSLRFSAV